MKVLIIGVNSFTGHELVLQLSERKAFQIYGVDIQEKTDLDKLLKGYLQLNILNFNGLKKLLQNIQPSFIYNLAGILKADADIDVYSINFIGALNILEAVKIIGAKNIKMLFVGSSAEYGMASISSMPITEDYICAPQTPYAISKYAATLAILNYFEKYQLKAVIVRPFNIIGKRIPKSMFVGAILKRIKTLYNDISNTTIEVGNINTYRDFIDVKDAVNAYINIMSGKYWGHVFNICSGKPIQLKKVLELLLSFSNKKIEYTINHDLERKNDLLSIYGSYDKANKAFGFYPVIPLEVSLKEAWDYEFMKI